MHVHPRSARSRLSTGPRKAHRGHAECAWVGGSRSSVRVRVFGVMVMSVARAAFGIPVRVGLELAPAMIGAEVVAVTGVIDVLGLGAVDLHPADGVGGPPARGQVE